MMNIRRILCMMLAMLLSGSALAETDLQAQLDAANARITELQAKVDTYYPHYAAQIVATYGENGVILLKDVAAEYEMLAEQYAGYGIDLAAYGMESYVKKELLHTAVQDAVLLAKAAELGLDTLSAEQSAAIEASARTALNGYLASYLDYNYSGSGEITDEMRAEADAYWADQGITYDSLYAVEYKASVLTAVYEYVVRDVKIGSRDIRDTYEALIEENKTAYADEALYCGDRDSGALMAWRPEGYRAVKHVLIGFDEEEKALGAELSTQLERLEAEKESAEGRSIEEIDEDIAACTAELDSLYAERMAEAEEVIVAFNAGESFDALIEKYNDDPGMQTEPGRSLGYAVCAGSVLWDPAFTEGATSIENPGEISGPVRGINGIHIIYYMGEIPGGEVPLEEIREEVRLRAIDDKINSTYQSQVNRWMEEMNVEYFYENFGITEE